MPHKFHQIQGWFTFPFYYTSIYNKMPENAHLVEIGSWLGQSACFMGELIKEGSKTVRFDCIDTFSGSPTEPSQHEIVEKHGGSIFNAFLHNMTQAGVQDVVNAICLDSVSASAMYEDESLDFVFIDGEHRNHACLRDIQAWWPKIKKGGVLAGHDITFDEVREDVVAFFGKYEHMGEYVWQVKK